MIEVSVAILNYNGLHFLKQFLPGLIRILPASSEVVIIDNASTDDSISWLKNEHSKVKLIPLDKNYGFAGGYNKGLEKLNTPYYLLLNSDVEVDVDFISPLLDKIKSQTNIAAVQPKILSQDQKDSFEYAGAAGGMIDYMGYPFCRGRIFDHCEKDFGQYDDAIEVFWASGAAFLVKADLFKKFGGFDAAYFAHMEEIDLCWRFKNAGYAIMVEPSSVVYHVGGGTLDYQNPRKTYLNFRNALHTIIKNQTSSKLLWILPTRLILDGLAGLRFLSRGAFSNLWSIIKAHWSTFFSIGSLIKSRKKIKAIRIENQISTEANEAGVFKKSIIWQYFIKKKNNFNQL